MDKIFIPANKPEDWKSLLAKPDKHWRRGYSAKTLAYSWQEANGFPECVRSVFKKSGIGLFQNIELLLAFPEYKVPLPGGRRASQSDIFILAKGNSQLISIMIEGKVSEPFDKTIAEWRLGSSKGKEIRLKFLCDELKLEKEKIDHIRYQLLHRTVSAVIKAKEFNARNALMLVHAFEKTKEKYKESFQAYCQFLGLFGAKGEIDSLVFTKNINGISLYFAWANGQEKYLRV